MAKPITCKTSSMGTVNIGSCSAEPSEGGANCHSLLLADSYNLEVLRRSKYVKFSKLLKSLLEHRDCSRKYQCNDNPKTGS
jgi:hypothetical protein